MTDRTPERDVRRLTPVVRLLVTDAFLLVALTLIPLVVLGSWGYGRAAEEVAHTRSLACLSRMGDALEARLARHRRAADNLARVCATHAIASCTPDGLAKLLVAIAPYEQSFRSLGLVLEDGRVVDVGQEGDALFTEACVPASPGMRCKGAHWLSDGTFLNDTAETLEAGRADPRERDWYKSALGRSDGRWGAPFLQQRDGPFSNRFRMTYSRAITSDPKSELHGAVAEVAVSLDEMLGDVRALQPSLATLTFITDADGRPVLLPNLPQFRGITATPTERPVAPDFLPLAYSFTTAAKNGGRLSVDGEEYYPQRVQFDREPGIAWVITMALPAREVLVGPRNVASVMIPVVLLIIAFACARAVGLARRFSRPLRDLARTTEVLAEGGEAALPETEIAEIREVGDRFLRASVLIRERAQLESELFHAQRVATIGALAGGIVHDLNNQLSVIMATLGSLEETGDHGEEIEVANEALRSCVELARGILAFSRGSSALRRTELDANVLVTNVVRLLGGTLRGSRIAIETELEPHLPGFFGDRVLIEQVLMNLAFNAKDAMPDGGRLTFTTMRTSTGQVAVAVNDTGQGMPPEVRERVLEAFFTTKVAGKGTGLGLSMVQGIVTAHEGKLRIDSAPGGGSTFTVLFHAVAEATVA